MPYEMRREWRCLGILLSSVDYLILPIKDRGSHEKGGTLRKQIFMNGWTRK